MSNSFKDICVLTINQGHLYYNMFSQIDKLEGIILYKSVNIYISLYFLNYKRGVFFAVL